MYTEFELNIAWLGLNRIASNNKRIQGGLRLNQRKVAININTSQVHLNVMQKHAIIGMIIAFFTKNASCSIVINPYH